MLLGDRVVFRWRGLCTSKVVARVIMDVLGRRLMAMKVDNLGCDMVG